MMGTLMKETRPFVFFAYIAVAMLMGSALFGAPVVAEYLATGLVERMPTWMLSMTLLLGAMLAMTAGAILDSLARSRVEAKHIHYLSIPSARGERVREGFILERREREGTPALRAGFGRASA